MKSGWLGREDWTFPEDWTFRVELEHSGLNIQGWTFRVELWGLNFEGWTLRVEHSWWTFIHICTQLWCFPWTLRMKFEWAWSFGMKAKSHYKFELCYSLNLNLQLKVELLKGYVIRRQDFNSVILNETIITSSRPLPSCSPIPFPPPTTQFHQMKSKFKVGNAIFIEQITWTE